MEKLIKTQEVAKICRVAQGTVIRWINEGRLSASTTVGGHNRVRLSDLVVLDLMLPGLDGYHVCEFIRQFPELKETKIIAISALNDPEVEKKFLALGANEFLVKPFDLDVLKKKIRLHLNVSTKDGNLS